MEGERRSYGRGADRGGPKRGCWTRKRKKSDTPRLRFSRSSPTGATWRPCTETGPGKSFWSRGRLERVLDLCTSCAESQPLRTREILETADRFAGEGMRVLAMAYKEAAPDLKELTHREVEGDLILAGIQGMMDPPRPEAIEAVRGCKEAGIRVVMITGDHPTTARAIGRMIGIGDGKSAVLTGKEVEAFTDEELFARVKEVSIYARVSPHHKLRITQQLQKHGEVVAVTGDGVNDAPGP